MSEKVPETEEEAKALGYKPATKSEWQAFIKKLPPTLDAHIKSLHTLESHAPVNCNDLPEHAKCLELPCIQGFRAIVYCDSNHTCTKRYLIPC